MKNQSAAPGHSGMEIPASRKPQVSRALHSVRRFLADLCHEDVRGPTNLPRNGAFK